MLEALLQRFCVGRSIASPRRLRGQPWGQAPHLLEHGRGLLHLERAKAVCFLFLLGPDHAGARQSFRVTKSHAALAEEDVGASGRLHRENVGFVPPKILSYFLYF